MAPKALVALAVLLAIDTTNAQPCGEYPTGHPQVTYAQAEESVTVTGVVKDENGLPLIGANIALKGTARGAVSDPEGRFTLVGVQVGAEVAISFIGYKTQVFEIKEDASGSGEQHLEVQMELDAAMAVDAVGTDGLYQRERSGLGKLLSKLQRVF